MKVSEARSLDREVVESGLTFAGFAVINNAFCCLRAFCHFFFMDNILTDLLNSSILVITIK